MTNGRMGPLIRVWSALPEAALTPQPLLLLLFLLLLLPRRRAGRRRRNRRRPAQRAANVVVVAALHLRAPLRHLRLELLLGERHRVAKVDEHVGDRSTATAGPVPRVRRVLVGRGRVEEPDQGQDRSLPQGVRAFG